MPAPEGERHPFLRQIGRAARFCGTKFRAPAEEAAGRAVRPADFPSAGGSAVQAGRVSV